MASIADIFSRPSGRPRTDTLPGAMVAIAVVASLCVVVLLVVVFWLSFTDGTPGDPELGYTLENYEEVFADPLTYTVLWNTLIFSGIALAVALALALPMAWLIERTDFPAKTVVFTFMTVALLIPGFSVALGWVFLLHPRVGIVNQVLMSELGLAEAPFNVSTLFGMGVIEGLSLTPVTFIMTAIVFRTMDSSLEEAASMGGANLWQTLRRVTVPLVWPGVLAASIYVYTIGFAAFDVPAIIGFSNRIYTFSTFVYTHISPTEGIPEYGAVATLSVIMVAFAAVLSWWYTRVQRQAPKYAVVTGKGYRPNIIKLGRAKGLAVTFVVLFFVFSQLIPVAALIWASALPFVQVPSGEALAQASLDNFRVLERGLIFNAMKNTGALMVMVPTITVIASVAFSWVVLRSKVAFRGLFDFFAFLPHTVPVIVFSVAAWLLALFVMRDILPIYGTIWILVLVYAIVRLSYGTRMTNSAMIQIHRELEESAKMSGAGTWGVLRSVLVPLLTPTILYAWIWIALLTYRELTLPVVLSTGDNQPLSVVVWFLLSTSSYGKASAVSVIMLVLMIPILMAYWAVARRTGIIPTR